MLTYDLSNYGSWEKLPWKQINERIFILQKRIYKASCQCNQEAVKYNQSIFTHSIEAKIKAIENVSKFISQYYLNHSNEQYICKNTYKYKYIYICIYM